MQKAWVYILECSDGSYYTGSTTKFKERMQDHHEGRYEGYTAKRRPLKLRWRYAFSSIWDAVKAERQIKGWSRKKKEALIRGDMKALHKLAQSLEMRERRNKRKGRDEGDT